MEILEGFTSSFIRSVSYDEETQKLNVYFKGREAEYIHEDVPKEIWENFKNADSKGTFYVANLKGKYIAKQYQKEKGQKND